MNIKELIKQMTLEEKASLCSGKNVWETENIDRLNIPSIMMADGPHGLRKQIDKSDNIGLNPSVPATCFPTLATVSCSFDRDLLKQLGKAIAHECIENDVDVILGPGVNIKRSPLCGRNFEYLSEDPYLTGELASAYIKGAQDLGVGVSVKHYAGNNQEKFRHIISSEIDERALREIYLAGFEKTIQEKPYTIMCSYNRVNGEYASESKYLLTDILRDEWGFDGLLITDWGACNDRVLGLKNGQDLEMPSSFGINDEKIVQAVKNGELAEEVLDRAVERILTLVFKCQEKTKLTNIIDNHHLAKKIAEESIVLLKNEENILPLKNQKIGVIGEFAKIPRIQGSGSSKINPIKIENVYDYLTDKNIPFEYARGYSIESDKIIPKLLKEAVNLAKEVDVVLLFVGLTEKYESEGYDREHMSLPYSHNKLIEEIAKVNDNIVVILSGGAPVEMPWVDKVKGLLNAYLSGESGALAIVDILYGKVNPSGKLAETYPVKLEDTPCFKHFPGGNNAVYYAESIYVGYRYYEKANKKVLFPFGHGLSYTSFAYKDLRFNKTEINEDEILEVRFTIKNTGNMPGKEICQLYVRDIESDVFKPVKELKSFEKVYLDVNEEKEITFKLDKRAFSYYNIEVKDWVVETGDYEILIGASSQDIRLKKKVLVISNKEIKSPYHKDKLPSYYDLNLGFNEEEFSLLYGKTLEKKNFYRKRPFNYNSTFHDIRRTLIGKLFIFGVKQYIKKTTKDKSARVMMINSLMDLPYRMFVNFGGNMFSKDLADGLLLIFNRSYIKGIKKILNSRK